jgi:hypothetical protein
MKLIVLSLLARILGISFKVEGVPYGARPKPTPADSP